MAEIVKLVTQTREGRGSQKARQLRKKGLIPAVVYGHKEATVQIALPGDEIAKAIRSGSHIVDLQTGKEGQTALIKEIQWDHLGKELLHVDFARVAADERVTVPVPVEIRGIAPGIAAGGVLDQPMHRLHLECPVISIPASVRVNVNELQLGAAIYVRDLVLPPGVTAKDDPDAIVVHVTVKVVEPEAVTEPAAEKAEPEVQARGKPKAEGEEAEGE